MKLKPLGALLEELENKPDQQSISVRHYLEELLQRKSQICGTCKFRIQGVCIAANGMLGAKAGDYCSLWQPKYHH